MSRAKTVQNIIASFIQSEKRAVQLNNGNSQKMHALTIKWHCDIQGQNSITYLNIQLHILNLLQE